MLVKYHSGNRGIFRGITYLIMTRKYESREDLKICIDKGTELQEAQQLAEKNQLCFKKKITL